MITAVDSNVLLDVLTADPTHGPASAEAIRGSLRDGSLVACEVVWAEIAAAFASTQEAVDTMVRLGVEYSAVDRVAALAAGSAWRRYRKDGGPRHRLKGDFLVGAHALVKAERLLTRDRGFYRNCFDGLLVFDPSAGA